MKTLWKLTNKESGRDCKGIRQGLYRNPAGIVKESGRDCKNYGVQSLNMNGRSSTNHQIIANAFNNHFATFPTMISRKINATNCTSTTSDNNQNNIFLFLKLCTLKLIPQY
jgi:hypothetical protein